MTEIELTILRHLDINPLEDNFTKSVLNIFIHHQDPLVLRLLLNIDKPIFLQFKFCH